MQGLFCTALIFKPWFFIPAAIVALLLGAYIARLVTKPRFHSKAVLYIGRFTKKANDGMLIIDSCIELKKYNKFKYLLNPFASLTAPLMDGVECIEGKKIVCKSPYFKASIAPKSLYAGALTCKELFTSHSKDGLIINDVEMPTGGIKENKARAIGSSETNFYFIPGKTTKQGDKELVERADVFCYVIEK